MRASRIFLLCFLCIFALNCAMADALASQLIVASHAVVYPAVAGVQDLSIQQLAAIPRFIKRALPDQVGAIMVHNIHH